MMSVGVETSHATLLQLQQEVVEKVDLSLLIPAMNTEGLLTPEQNSHVDNSAAGTSQPTCVVKGMTV